MSRRHERGGQATTTTETNKKRFFLPTPPTPIVLLTMHSFLQDLRFAARVLRRNPGFTAAAVLSLALAIGANTALFSLLDALLWRMLPVQDPQQLVALNRDVGNIFTYAHLNALRDGTQSFSAVAGVERLFDARDIEEAGSKHPVFLQLVTGEFWDALGVSAWRGRVFRRGQSEAGGPIAVISFSYWQRHYRSSGQAIGSHFRWANVDLTVAGIAPPGFQGVNADAPADIWIDVETALRPDGYTRGGVFSLLARLRPGVSERRAEEEAGARLRRKIGVEPQGGGLSKLRQRFARPILILAAVAGLVLLIGCANLANLLLAGASARRRELAVRQAIGAGTGRLIRQLITESLLLAGIGGALGIPAARWISQGLLRFLPASAQPALANLSFHPDGRVLAFTAGASLLACLLFGVAPAIRATRAEPSGGLKETAGVSRKWGTRSLAVAEIALCTLLVCGAGMFVETLRNLRTLDAGFEVEHTAMATVQTPPGISDGQRVAILSDLRRRVAQLPGAAAVGYSHIQQLSGFGIEERAWPQGGAPDPKQAYMEEQRVSPGFFDAMATPLLRGRDFTESDAAAEGKIAIVNQTFAQIVFPGRNPIGLRFNSDSSPKDALQIVGLVKDTKWMNLRQAAPPTYYVPYAQAATTYVTLAIRTAGNVRALAAALPGIVHDADSRLTVADPATFAEIEDRTLVVERQVADVSSAFGALALCIACVGIYGILAYGVARRTREIGVRMALGASRQAMHWMVLRESLAIVAAGFAIGAPVALAGGRLVRSMLFGVAAFDAATLAAAFAILLATAAIAAYVPARRAAAVDPMNALRYD